MGRLFQVSAMFALMAGDFDYSISIEYFMKNGDTGIGSFNGLNGEAIFLDGVAYNGTAAGQVKVMDIPMTGVTYGQITKFDPSVPSFSLDSFSSFEDLQKKLSEHQAKGPNYFYCLRAEGKFSSVTVRAAYKQRKPYRPMSIVAKEMRYYTCKDIEGTLVGFYSPSYVNGLAIPGWHLHFLSKDKTKGGHVTEASGLLSGAKINLIDKYEVKLPSHPAFAKGDFSDVPGLMKSALPPEKEEPAEEKKE